MISVGVRGNSSATRRQKRTTSRAETRDGGRGIDDAESAVAEYVDGFHQRGLHSEIGQLPPVEFETRYRETQPAEVPQQIS